jgi:hypothetical protein
MDGGLTHLFGVKQMKSVRENTTHNGVETGYGFMSVVIEASKSRLSQVVVLWSYAQFIDDLARKHDGICKVRTDHL